MSEFLRNLGHLLSYLFQELSSFGFWLGLGMLLGGTMGLLCAWACSHKVYPRKKLDLLDGKTLPVPRWLFLTMPLWRWSWWLTWWSAIPSCLIGVGLVWGAAQGCYRAVLNQPLAQQASRRASLQVLTLIWDSQAPPHLQHLDAERTLPLSVVFPVLEEACRHPVASRVPALASQEKIAWLADVMARNLMGWYLHCRIDSRLYYLASIKEEICHQPAPLCHTVSLHQLADRACTKFVEPQLALWSHEWVLRFAWKFLAILLGLLLAPLLCFEVILLLLRWRARVRKPSQEQARGHDRTDQD